jgi:aryl-alcohol dehydrogenase-like predicted oxidoreductase
MKLNRRELIAISAGASAYLGLGLRLAHSATADLITKAIPGSSEQLPVIGIGTNRWVADGDAAETAALRETLKSFHDYGGRVIDTAPAYRTSEQALGKIIAELNFSDAFFLATKVDRAGQQEGVTRMQDSLQKLGRTRLDLMQVHNLKDADTQLQSMLEWKQQGLLRYVGITTSRNDQFAEMERLMNTFALDFVQVNYSLGDREAAERVLPTALDNNIAVLVNRPFTKGRLFKAVRTVQLPEWSADFDASSWAQFFLKYVVSHPAVTCAIPGMTKATHVTDNMGTARGALADAASRQQQEGWFDLL